MAVESLITTTVGVHSSMSDTQWETYIQFICDAFDNVGFARTACSGQFDPATVARPTTATYVWEQRYLVSGDTTLYANIGYNYNTIQVNVGSATDGAWTLIGDNIYNNSTPCITLDLNGDIRVSGGEDYQ